MPHSEDGDQLALVPRRNVNPRRLQSVPASPVVDESADVRAHRRGFCIWRAELAGNMVARLGFEPRTSWV